MHKMYKRGKVYPLVWTGGTQQNILNFDLYKGGKLIHPFSNVANVNQTKIKIPTAVKTGKGYYFKVTDTRNKDQIVVTAPFSIKRKVPLFLTATTILLGGGAVYLLGVGSAENNIPDPLEPGSIRN